MKKNTYVKEALQKIVDSSEKIHTIKVIMFKKILISLLVSLLSGHSAFALFLDTEYSWYKDSITTLASEKIINGFDDGTFGPEKSITRAEILKIILQASGNGLGETPLEKCFPDVSQNMWYHAYICRAYMLRVTNGFSDGTFKPNNTVTTLEALAFGFRAFSIPIPQTGSGELWYEPLRKMAHDNHILSSDSYTLDTPISRGKASELILKIRFYKQSPKVQSYGSPGCQIGKNLSTKNTITIGSR
jgi:S-layer homology domain